MEPNLSQIDDYYNKESSSKRKIVAWIVFGIVSLGIVLQGFKYYYDRHTPACFDPVVIVK